MCLSFQHFLEISTTFIWAHTDAEHSAHNHTTRTNLPITRSASPCPISPRLLQRRGREREKTAPSPAIMPDGLLLPFLENLESNSALGLLAFDFRLAYLCVWPHFQMPLEKMQNAGTVFNTPTWCNLVRSQPVAVVAPANERTLCALNDPGEAMRVLMRNLLWTWSCF